MREKISLSKLVQMVPHLLIGGPERQNRICREIKIAWMPEMGKPGRVKPTPLQSSRKSAELGTQDTLEMGSGHLDPITFYPTCAARGLSLPHPKNTGDCLSAESEPGACWGEGARPFWGQK